MVLTVDPIVELPDVPPGQTRRWHFRCLATQAGSVPIKVHLLPTDQMSEDVLD